jgi:protein gp37
MALRLATVGGTTADKYEGTAKRARDGRPVFAGRINLDRASLDIPLGWRKPKRVFVNSMSDLFHADVPEGFIRRVFGVMERCPQHQFQILTKRPERAAELAPRLSWPENVWMGTSVESAMYVHRVHDLRRIGAAVRFLSVEPLLGRIRRLPLDGIHWVIVGGESGPGARPMESEWVTEIRDQCIAKDVSFFFKQWGGVRKCETGRVLEGRTWDEMPELETA